MPQQIESSTHSLESNFYIYKITPYVEHDYKWVPLYLRPMVILTKCVISILFSAIVLAFGILTPKIDKNTQLY